MPQDLNIETKQSIPDTDIPLTPEEQAIADRVSGKEVEPDNTDDIELPSDKRSEDDNNDKKYAGKYDSIEDLRKGIGELNSTLPDYVLEGMSDEALERHYKELESNFHKDNSGRKHSQKEENTKETDDNSDSKPEAVPQELWSELQSEFERTGSITNEQYDALNKVGIPDEVIDNYIDGISAKQVEFTNSIYDIAGGQEQYEIIKSWAEENYPAEQIEAISRMDKNGMLMAMKGIKADFDAQNPTDTSRRLMGDTRGVSTGSYRDQSDYIIDVSDKRYGMDKRYTKMVDDKFANSKHLH